MHVSVKLLCYLVMYLVRVCHWLVKQWSFKPYELDQQWIMPSVVGRRCLNFQPTRRYERRASWDSWRIPDGVKLSASFDHDSHNVRRRSHTWYIHCTFFNHRRPIASHSIISVIFEFRNLKWFAFELLAVYCVVYRRCVSRFGNWSRPLMSEYLWTVNWNQTAFSVLYYWRFQRENVHVYARFFFSRQYIIITYFANVESKLFHAIFSAMTSWRWS